MSGFESFTFSAKIEDLTSILSVTLFFIPEGVWSWNTCSVLGVNTGLVIVKVLVPSVKEEVILLVEPVTLG